MSDGHPFGSLPGVYPHLPISKFKFTNQVCREITRCRSYPSGCDRELSVLGCGCNGVNFPFPLSGDGFVSAIINLLNRLLLLSLYYSILSFPALFHTLFSSHPRRPVFADVASWF